MSAVASADCDGAPLTVWQRAMIVWSKANACPTILEFVKDAEYFGVLPAAACSRWRALQRVLKLLVHPSGIEGLIFGLWG
jgi:hypothetical protein